MKILKVHSNVLKENVKKMVSLVISERKRPTTNQVLPKSANAKQHANAQEREHELNATFSCVFLFLKKIKLRIINKNFKIFINFFYYFIKIFKILILFY